VGIEVDVVNNIDFGEAEAILSNKSDNSLAQLLFDLTNELINDLREELNKHRATGNLQQSIIPTQLNPAQIEVTAPYYWKYLNYGVNGTEINRGAPTHGQAPKTGLSFHDAIKKWIYDKGIPIPQGSTHDGLAYAIQKRLVTNGIEATHFYDKVVTPQRVEEMSKPISALIKESIITIIKKPTT
jgi:hypothetical protein